MLEYFFHNNLTPYSIDTHFEAHFENIVGNGEIVL